MGNSERPEPKITRRDRRSRDSSLGKRQVRRIDNKDKPGLARYTLTFLYKNLYILGITLLRRKNRLKRRVRRFFLRLRGNTYAGFERLGRNIRKLWKGFIRRLKAPFIRVANVRVQMRPVIADARKDGKIPLAAYGKITVTFLRLLYAIIRTLVNYAAPVLAAYLLLMVVGRYSNKPVGLEVRYNDESIGFIQNERDFEDATKLLNERFITDTESDTLVITPQFVLREAEQGEAFTSPKNLANSIVWASGNDIEWGYGFYVDDNFYGAVTESEPLIEELEQILEEHSTGLEGEQVEFVKRIKVEDALYPASSIVDMEDLFEVLYSEEELDAYYTVQDGDSPSLIATKNDVTYAELLELNPELEDEGVRTGQQVLLVKSKPYMSVKNIYETVYQEEFPYDTEEIPTDVYVQGYRDISIPGQPGVQEVTARISEVDGQEIEREILDTKIVKLPVTQKIIVGTLNRTQVLSQPQSDDGFVGSSAGFMWPTSGGRITVPLWGYYDHTGVDIPRPAGTPIFASASGTVVKAVAGWTAYGHHIIIDHGNGYTTYYAHASALHVGVGQYVNQGDVIASVGRTGNATGNHLHFEVRLNGQVMNPAHYIG